MVERKGNSVKKTIALALVLLMLPVAASAEKTDRRGLVEFIELYASRFAVWRASPSGCPVSMLM